MQGQIQAQVLTMNPTMTRNRNRNQIRTLNCFNRITLHRR